MRLPDQPPCPKCKRILDGFTGVGNNDSPSAGDLSVCGYCAQPLTWNGKGWDKLEGDALVLARLDENFLVAEAAARMAMAAKWGQIEEQTSAKKK